MYQAANHPGKALRTVEFLSRLFDLRMDHLHHSHINKYGN